MGTNKNLDEDHGGKISRNSNGKEGTGGGVSLRQEYTNNNNIITQQNP